MRAKISEYRSLSRLAMRYVYKHPKLGKYIHAPYGNEDNTYAIERAGEPLFDKFMREPGVAAFLLDDGSGASVRSRGLKVLHKAYIYKYLDSGPGEQKTQRTLARELYERLRNKHTLSLNDRLVFDAVFELAIEEGPRVLADLRRVTAFIIGRFGEYAYPEMVRRGLSRIASLFSEITVEKGRPWQKGKDNLATIVELDISEDVIAEAEKVILSESEKAAINEKFAQMTRDLDLEASEFDRWLRCALRESHV